MRGFALIDPEVQEGSTGQGSQMMRMTHGLGLRSLNLLSCIREGPLQIVAVHKSSKIFGSKNGGSGAKRVNTA